MSQLKEEGVFAREVRTSGVAFHSYYMASIAPSLLAALKEVRHTHEECHRNEVTFPEAAELPGKPEQDLV